MLSIIIPVYNSEKYLEKCINSVLAQVYTDFELILIDDGSKDMSPAICDAFASADERVRVVHKTNGGVSSARNTGLDMARGKFIMFIDSDDWIEPDFCKNLMLLANEFDLVIGGYTMVDKAGKEKFSSGNRSFRFPEQLGEYFDCLFSKNSLNAPFSKIYRREFLQDQRFDTAVSLGEDFLFNLEYLSKCSKIRTTEETGYLYNCLNEGAATKKLRENDIRQIVFLYRKGKHFLHKYCPTATESIALKQRLCMNGVNLIQLVCYSDKTREEKHDLARELLESTDFVEACKQDYDLPLKYDIPRKLCASGSWIGLQGFFGMKRIISNVMKRV